MRASYPDQLKPIAECKNLCYVDQMNIITSSNDMIATTKAWQSKHLGYQRKENQTMQRLATAEARNY